MRQIRAVPATPDAPASAVRSQRKLRRALVFLVVVMALGTAAWFFRAPLLTGLARAWELDDPPQQADAIVVLGGGLNTRPFAAVKLYQQGLAPKILLAETKATPPNVLGVTERETDHSRNVLVKLGIPESAILTFGKDVTSTHEEALGLREWLKTTGARRVLVPTDSFHTRRVSWLLHHILPDDTAITLVSTPSLYYDMTNWWQREEGLITFQNEIIKLLYYRLRY